MSGLKRHREKTTKIVLALNPYDICTGALTWRAMMTTRTVYVLRRCGLFLGGRL